MMSTIKQVRDDCTICQYNKTNSRLWLDNLWICYFSIASPSITDVREIDNICSPFMLLTLNERFSFCWWKLENIGYWPRSYISTQSDLFHINLLCALDLSPNTSSIRCIDEHIAKLKEKEKKKEIEAAYAWMKYEANGQEKAELIK